ncbi:glycosyltransferase [Halorubrum vacuolatum]|uniref:Glycosyl transferase family 2 n=1 Tax=Halorubrum vacuolatum TaxID=63740 RepID=A0A238XQR6_HALVU|nr:glycosyltransferase [Halorubrum vacuolatum]SNR60918.1 Glycosyl transferase family 2 [Halorubrum vacuolatum]
MSRAFDGRFPLSVVIATYERPAMTVDLIQSIRTSVSNFRTRDGVSLEFECLVCCSKNDETTIETLETVDWPELKVITTDNQAASHNRDVGFRRASGAYIAVVDSDCIVADDWIGAIYDALRTNKYPDVLQGAYFYDYQEERSRYTVIEANEDFSRFKDRQADSRNLIFHRDAYSGIGGYDTDHLYADAGEDLVLRNRVENAGYRFCFAEQVKVYHRYPTGLVGNLKRYNRYGRGAVHIKWYYPEMYGRYSPWSFTSSTLKQMRSFIIDQTVSTRKLLFRILKTCSFLIGFLQGLVVYRLEAARTSNGLS